MLWRLEWQRKQGVSAIEGGSCGFKRRWQWLFGGDEEEDIKAIAEEGLAAVEVARKRRRRQRGLTRATVAATAAGEQRGPARKRLGSAEGRRNDTARSVGREEVAAVGKSGRQRPIDGERRAVARMIDSDEGARQQQHLGAVGDSDRGLGDGDSGRGWATIAEG
ncbi:hypothetical protein BHM03_00030666 [Ensete ventricosum]|nr:hypothetical protein BHM03_00030666 [Ensete ventricosum]